MAASTIKKVRRNTAFARSSGAGLRAPLAKVQETSVSPGDSSDDAGSVSDGGSGRSLNEEETAYMRRGQGERRRIEQQKQARLRVLAEQSGLEKKNLVSTAPVKYLPADFPRAWALFKVMDTDNNGVVTSRELRRLLKKASAGNMSVESILDVMDINHDKQIVFDEFVGGFDKVWGTAAGKQLLEAAMAAATQQGHFADKTAEADQQKWKADKQRREALGGLKLESLKDSISSILGEEDWQSAQHGCFDQLRRKHGHEAPMRIYCGGGEELLGQVLADAQVRVFLSSTFTDTSAERNLLMASVWPEVRQFCGVRGVTFEVVDMRWGIRDECTDDQQTVAICMHEIDRCQDGTIGPCFLHLGTDKYGWRPPPQALDVQTFERMLNRCSEANQQMLESWYCRDDNLNPPLYVLQRISKVIPRYLSEVLEERWEAGGQWWDTQTAMAAAFAGAAKALGMEWEQLSVTELEVHRGVLRRPDLAKRAIVVKRKIVSPMHEMMSDPSARFYLDTVDGALDQPAQELLAGLRRKVASAVPKEQFRRYHVDWREGGVTLEHHSEYVRDVCLDIREMLLQSVHDAILENPLPDQLTREILRHSKYTHSAAEHCLCRDALLKRIRAYVSNQDGLACPLVVYGQQGVGKTAVMARAALDARVDLGESACVVTRYCGSTATSSVMQKLLTSVVQQLATVFGKDPSDHIIPNDIEELFKLFGRWCKEKTDARPLVIFLDSLESIEQPGEVGASRSHGVRWLPTELPQGCKIVVSINPNHDNFDKLRGMHWKEEAYVEVKNLSISKLETIVDKWLKADGRDLQPEQRSELMDSLNSSQDGASGLMLKLAYRHTRSWSSYDGISALPQSVPAYIQEIFSRLEKYFGYELVAKAFSYLVCTRHGLSEREWLDLLSCDDQVMDAVLQYHQPPIRRLPPSVLTRMRQEMGEYLVERSADGVPVITWKYSIFKDVASNRYVKTVASRRMISNNLANYFDGILHIQMMDREVDAQPLFFAAGVEQLKVPNVRKLGELPHALLGAGDRERLAQRLCDLEVFVLYSADQVLLQEMMMYWRDIGDVLDPVEAYGNSLEARHKRCKSDQDLLRLADLYDDVGKFFDASARFEAAIDICTKALHMREGVLGDGHPDLADDIDALAMMYGNMGMYEEALPLLQKSMTILKTQFGPADPRVSVSLNNLASLHQSLGAFDEAMQLYETILVVFEETCGEESAEVGILLCNQGSLYATQGALDDATAVLNRALPILESKYGVQHPNVGNCLNNLATVLLQQNMPNAALGYMERDLSICEKVLGPEHPDVAVALLNLAQLFSRTQEHTKAQQSAKRALQIYQNVYGEFHVEVAGALNTLGGVYTAQKMYDAAEPLFRGSLEIHEKVFGAEHTQTLKCKRNLSSVLRHRPGGLNEALNLALMILQSTEDTHEDSKAPDDILELAQAQQEVAELYEAMGDFQNSIEARQRAIDMFSEVLGKHHHLVTVRYNQLAVLYSKLNRHNEAVQCVRDRLDLPANHGCILPPPMTPDDVLNMYFIKT